MEERILSYLDALEAALVQHGDDIANGALMWARIDAASGLLIPMVCLVVGVTLALIAGFGHALPAHRAYDEAWKIYVAAPYRSDEKEIAYFRHGFHSTRIVLGYFALAISSAISIVSLFNILSLWRWVGIFAPELWLVHKAMSAVGA